MQITWLGHSGFRIEIGDQVLIVDPWFNGNPMFPIEKAHEATKNATCCLVSHAHSDHSSDAINLSKNQKIPLVGIYDFISFLEKDQNLEGIGFNRGGRITMGNVDITMVSASHSSSFLTNDRLTYGGNEAGFMISSNGRTIYFSGDTDIMADMEWFEELHKPEIGLLCAGGHFTMDMERAAFAAKKYFNFKTVIPCHYKTFPVLEQSAEKLKAKLPKVKVIEPVVMEPIFL